jgi:hypothetical protein
VIDVESLIGESFSRLYPIPAVSPDWDEVLGRAGARPRRRAVRRLALVLALALAIGGIVLAGSYRGKGPDVLDRAQAALNPDGRILHVVSRWVDDRVTFDELWSLPDGSLQHVVIRPALGEFGADCVDSASETRCWNPQANVVDVYPHPPPEPVTRYGPAVQYGASWPKGLRDALASDNARVLGRASFCGKPAVAVLLAVPGRPGPPQYEESVSHTLFLDPETYLPVAERMPESGTIRYFDTFEFLPDTPENRRAVELPAPADAKVVVHRVGEHPPEEKDGWRGALGPQCTPPR